jgi:hypothetical protein
MNTSFGILTISHGRDKILRMFCSSIQRLRYDLDMYIPTVVVGDAEHESICNEYFIHHIPMQNHPCTDKWNRGVDYLMSQNCKYVVVMGSDDIISTDLVKNLIKEMDKGIDLIGVNTIWFYATDGKYRGQMRKLVSEGQILGVARCISSRIINQVGGVLWDKPKSWGMDGICLRNILRYVKTRAIVDGFVCDLKSVESLNKWTMWQGRLKEQINPRELYNILSEEELKILIGI